MFTEREILRVSVSSANSGKVLELLSRVSLLACLLDCGTAAHGQNCPAPWATATNAYGIVMVSGDGTGTYLDLSQSVNQNAQANVKMPQLLPGSCNFMAVPAEGFGQVKSTANVSDSLINTTNGSSITWTASGPGDSSGANASFVINPAQSQYGFGAWDATMGTYTSSDAGTVQEDIYWGPGSTSGGGAVSQVPFPAGAAMVWGTSTFSSPPLDDAQGSGVINANWEVDWLFAAGPDEDCPACRAHDAPAKGSVISPRGQALGEDVDIVGTPFFLHYESSRVPGHAGADLFAMKDALSLGGWTLSAHHVFEPLLLGYCAGGSCTPYSVAPKAVFFGDGNSRNDADVQAAVSLNGNYLITSDDGSEVYAFNGKGMHLQTRRPFTGAVVFTFAYDAQNRLITVTDANGNVTSIDRDGSGKPLSITSPYGQKTTLTVDSHGYLSKITDPAGHSTTLTSSSTGLLSSLTDPNRRAYSYTYDGMGMLTKHSDPAGGSITLARTNTATGYSVLNTTAAGRKSTYAVTFASTATQTSQASTTTWPNGLIATGSQTQQNGQVTDSATLPNGSSYTTTLGPDPRWGMQVPIVASESLTRGNLTEMITQSRTATLGTPGDPFSLTSQKDTTTINGRVYTSVYTASNKSIVDKTPVGRTTTTLLDSQERASSVRLGSLAASSLTYDSLGRISAITQGTRTTTLTYDANGNLANTTNPLSLTRSYTYDAAGNLLTTTLEDGRVVKFTYDADGNLRSVTPPGETAHAYAYSPVNLPTTYTPPSVAGTGATTYAYNADRDVTKITRPDGATISNKYDPAGRLTSIVLPTSTIIYGYSATTGHLSKAAVSGGETIVYSYNGSLPTRAVWTGTVAGTVSRAYNNNFWKSSEGVTGGSNISFTYDKDGLLTKAGSLTLTRSASSGLYTGGTLASTTDSIAYNTFAEPTSYAAQFGSTILYGATYTRDKIGRVSAMNETIGGTTTAYAYSFDKAGRLTGVKKGGVTVSSYAYDHNSNRMAATTSPGTVHGTYDAQDRLLTYGSASYTYTANGELATNTVGTQNTTYQYDALGNLTAVTLPNGTAITYIIDAASNRVGKEVNGVVTAGFLYDGERLVAQLDSSNKVMSQFVFASQSGAPEYMIAGGVTYRIFSDHRGSPRLVVNSTTGAITQRMDFDEFGNVTNDTNPGFQPFGFAGGLYDPDTKLVRFGARDYDASTGRWTAKDPLRFDGGGTNLYGYVVNDPINLIDPSGLEGKGTCPCKDDAPRRDKKLSEQTKKAADNTIKTPDGKISNGPKLPENPNSDRIGITKAPGSKTTDVSSPLSVEKGGITVKPFSAGGKIPGTDFSLTMSMQLTVDLSRTMTLKDGARNHMTLPYPVSSEVGLACEFNW